jgi:hypothetical protein
LPEKIFASKPQCFLPPNPLSQDGAELQGSQAAISAPQLGAAYPEPHGEAISAPQLGPIGSQLGAHAALEASLPFRWTSLPFK